MKPKAKILVVDDHPLFSVGLKLMLETQASCEVIGICANGIEMLNFLKQQTPSIVLVDIKMPILNGEEAIEQALHQYPTLKIIAITSEDNELTIQRIAMSGIKGLVPKTSCEGELIEAIEIVNNGGIYFSQNVFNQIVNGLKQPEKEKEPLHSEFSEREMEIISLICEGKTSKEIAAELFISPRTVDNHKSNIFEKAGVNNAISLAVYMFRNNLIS